MSSKCSFTEALSSSVISSKHTSVLMVCAKPSFFIVRIFSTYSLLVKRVFSSVYFTMKSTDSTPMESKKPMVV
jgi:hypothetical protein